MALVCTQANGRDILGSNCSVGLASSMPPLHEGLGRENVSDQPDVGGKSGGNDGGVYTPGLAQRTGSTGRCTCIRVEKVASTLATMVPLVEW